MTLLLRALPPVALLSMALLLKALPPVRLPNALSRQGGRVGECAT